MEDRRLEKNCDIVVVGAGHAGCEAALACARPVSYTHLDVYKRQY